MAAFAQVSAFSSWGNGRVGHPRPACSGLRSVLRDRDCLLQHVLGLDREGGAALTGRGDDHDAVLEGHQDAAGVTHVGSDPTHAHPPAALGENVPVGRHTGERAEDETPPPRSPRRRIFVLSLLVTLTLIAWGVLVYAAIDFGREARSGEPDAWTFLAIAAVGAAACLFVTMILGTRLVALVRGRAVVPPRPTHAQGRRRATR